MTQSSRDGGVDCVAYDNRAIFGGKVIIQAKRYKNTVPVSAVRDLFGSVHNEGATKGILVTHLPVRQSLLRLRQRQAAGAAIGHQPALPAQRARPGRRKDRTTRTLGRPQARHRPRPLGRAAVPAYDAGMTTERDHGNHDLEMLRCELGDSHLYSSLVLALRDMRQANGRDPTTGHGDGNQSWIALSLAMIVLDTLSGQGGDDRGQWVRLLRKHGLSTDDAEIVFKLRCSLLHGYHPPKPEHINGQRVLLSGDGDGYALDTWHDGFVLVSVPVFCARLVERIVVEAPGEWDVSLIDTAYHPSRW
jgi:hypothetical protein